MKKTICLLLLLISEGAMGQESNADKSVPEAKPLSALAQSADFIGVVQVQSIDYETTRDLPSKGFALLETLVVYRYPGDKLRPPRHIQVYEKGFAKNACYYPQRWNEGRRFLVFLEKRKEGGFEGVKPYCMLPVLITESFHYALRFPVPGVEIADKSPVQHFRFTDPDAYAEPGDTIPYSRARAFQKAGFLRETEDGDLIFTRGILLSDVRALMFGRRGEQSPQMNAKGRERN